MSSKTILRAHTPNTTDFTRCISAYANAPYTVEVRLCTTQRYVHESELPTPDFTLLQNTPLLLAVAVVKLPATSAPIYIVIDYPGLTMQRENRATEIRDLVDQLLTGAAAKLHYGLQPIIPTSHLTADAAAGQLLGCDYAQLTPETRDDFLRRLT